MFGPDYSWQRFYALLEQLPAWGKYKSALAMDEDFARRACDAEDAGQQLPPGMDDDETAMSPAGYSAVVSRLDLIADRVMSVRTAVQAGYSQDHEEPSFQTLPRPMTALERERERRNLAELGAVADEFLGGGGLSLA